MIPEDSLVYLYSEHTGASISAAVLPCSLSEEMTLLWWAGTHLQVAQALDFGG